MKYLICIFFFLGCSGEKVTKYKEAVPASQLDHKNKVKLIVLGTAQDGGSPHIGCKKQCCSTLWGLPDKTRKVVSLGVVDNEHKKRYIFEASPDFTSQVATLNKVAGEENDRMPDGIIITHAHIGHYTGLMFLGREAKGAHNVPVYIMPKMSDFLSNNGPWDQLVNLQNIKLNELHLREEFSLTSNLNIKPIQVPHRDEYSETVGFVISGEHKSALFIPDIDKWEKWNEDIVDWISKVDYAFLDATFFDANEINNRDISEIPHPFVIESIDLFRHLSSAEKEKIHFIHLNHTNPLWNRESEEYKQVRQAGFRVAHYGQEVAL